MQRSKLGIKRPRINSENLVAAANKCISGELSINEASRRFNISKTTLTRHVQSFRKSEATEKKVKQVFSREEEAELKTYLLTAAAWLNHGLSRMEIRTLAYQYAIENEKSCPLSWTKLKIAGAQWLRQFLRRHGDLSLRSPEFTPAGSTSFQENVASFFKNYEELLSLIDYSPGKIWNFYEFGLTTLHDPKSLGPKRIEQIGEMSSDDRSQNITLIASVNAIGDYIPPMIIFPRTHFEPRMLKGSPIGTIGGASPSGWTNESLFLVYLVHFKNHVKPRVEDPVILLLDNHVSYMNIKTIDFCKNNGIHMMTFHPHISGKMQPLNRTVSEPMKAYYNTACSEWMSMNPGQPITIYDIAELIGYAFPKAFSSTNIKNGFKVSGIYPANVNIFEDHEFLSATGRPLNQSNETHERLDIEQQKGEQDSYEDLPCEEVSEAKKSAIDGLIPSTSIGPYESTYKDFKEWCDIKTERETERKKVSENVMLAYFEYKTKKVQPTTLYSIYSKLKTTLRIKENVDIAKYPKLVQYLKHKCVGCIPRKSKVLTKEEIETFLREAPDDYFLLTKVILIFVIYGACRRTEMLNLTVDDIEDKDSIVIVKIQDSPIHTQRTFIISNLKHIKIYRKYHKLRPKVVATRRFFIRYFNRKWVNEVVGIHKIPKEIATYLKLPEPESYTTHYFRKSSGTLTHDSGIGPLLADSGRNAKDQGKSEPQEPPEPQQPPQFENIYVDETSEQHVDIKEEILEPEESFDTLTTAKIMQVIDYDKNGHSIEQQMSLMKENVFIKNEILENFDMRTNPSLFDLNIKNEEMNIKDEVDIVEDYLNQRLANVSMPVVEVGFSEANSNNLPKIDLLTIMEYFHEHDNSIFAEIRRLKSEPLIRRNNYEDNTIGYVQIKQEASFCEIKASVTPENDAITNNCDVWCRINTVINVVMEVSCQNCPIKQGGCIHCVAFLMWLYRKSVDPSLAEEVSYWRKPELKSNLTRKNVTTEDSGKRKVAAEDSLQGSKKRKIQSNIDTYHNPEFNSLSIQCLATSFKKCSLTKNAENFQKFSELHLNPELILNLEEVTRNQSQSPLWQEMRYGRVPSSKAYDVIRCKTMDESLEENVLGANICDSEAVSTKFERKTKVLSMLSSETSLQFFKTGIVLSSENPFVEATPDAIHDTFVVEIKCPKTEKSLHEYLDSDGNMKQKYFYQMQLLMRLTKKEKGMFVIAKEDFESSKKLIINYCDYDEYFSNTILNGINEFWTKNIYNKVL